MKQKRQRLDEIMVTLDLAASVTSAQGLIMAGKVVVDDQRVDKPGTMIGPEQVVRIKGQERRYVSRAGEKLAGALLDLQMVDLIQGKRAIDIGASTGGFTDCLLQHGAEHVFAVDVGTNQLAYSIRQDERVTAMEKCDIRALDVGALGSLDIVVADVSFNSLARLADAFWHIPFHDKLTYLLLVKPQFELPSECIGEGGIVSDPALQQHAVDTVKEAFQKLGGADFVETKSRITGRTGNQEIFLRFARLR